MNRCGSFSSLKMAKKHDNHSRSKTSHRQMEEEGIEMRSSRGGGRVISPIHK